MYMYMYRLLRQNTVYIYWINSKLESNHCSGQNTEYYTIINILYIYILITHLVLEFVLLSVK